MDSKKKRQLRKEKKLRAKFDKIKRKEYSKSYLKMKDARNIEPHSYPLTKLVLVRDFFRSKDLYKAIGLFLGSQVAVFLLLVGTKQPKLTPIIGLLSMLIGVICIIASVREINRRQSMDVSRKAVDLKLIFKTLVLIFTGLIIATTLNNMLGAVEVPQPNQDVIDGILSLFPIPMIFTMVLVAPVVEETIFRELLPFATGPSHLSFILTSFLFVLIHSPSGIFGWVMYGLSTVGFLIVRMKNNNVYAAIILHILWNILSLVL